MDADAVAERVGELLESSEVGTVVVVRPDASVVADTPGTTRSAWERRGRVVAVFVATRQPPGHTKIRRRIDQGFQKLQQ